MRTEFVRRGAGKCRLLRVAAGQRSKFAPDVPTFAEQGFKDMV